MELTNFQPEKQLLTYHSKRSRIVFQTTLSYSLTIQTKTWNKNSFGLFDYESRDIQKKIIKVVGTCKGCSTFVKLCRQTNEERGHQGFCRNRGTY